MIPDKLEGESYHFPPIPPIAGSECFAFIRYRQASPGAPSFAGLGGTRQPGIAKLRFAIYRIQ